jgi:hypothetical protein
LESGKIDSDGARNCTENALEKIPPNMLLSFCWHFFQYEFVSEPAGPEKRQLPLFLPEAKSNL